MILNLVQISTGPAATISLAFTDGSTGTWSAADVIARNSVMTRPLADPAYFARAFIESGALAWPNGFGLSASNLHRRMDEAGTLRRPTA